MADSGPSGHELSPDDHLAWCHDAVENVSRTFALSIELLDEPMANFVCVGYLLCRIPDTIEDAARIPSDEKARLLEQYADVVAGDTDVTVEAFRADVDAWIPDDPRSPADWEIVRRADRVFAAYEAFDPAIRGAIRAPTRELTDGMAEFVARSDGDAGLRIATREELDRYCYFVAGTVGHLTTNLVALDVDAETERYLRDRAESFGSLLQLVNIVKDVYTDRRDEDNVYVPAEWLDVHGVPQTEILAPQYRAGAGVAVKRVIDHARSFRHEAREYLDRMIRETDYNLGAWVLPYLLAIATLRELDADLDAIFTEESVKVSRTEVTSLLAAVASGPLDAARLSDLEHRVEIG